MLLVVSDHISESLLRFGVDSFQHVVFLGAMELRVLLREVDSEYFCLSKRHPDPPVHLHSHSKQEV